MTKVCALICVYVCMSMYVRVIHVPILVRLRMSVNVLIHVCASLKGHDSQQTGQRVIKKLYVQRKNILATCSVCECVNEGLIN